MVIMGNILSTLPTPTTPAPTTPAPTTPTETAQNLKAQVLWSGFTASVEYSNFYSAEVWDDTTEGKRYPFKVTELIISADYLKSGLTLSSNTINLTLNKVSEKEKGSGTLTYYIYNDTLGKDAICAKVPLIFRNVNLDLSSGIFYNVNHNITITFSDYQKTKKEPYAVNLNTTAKKEVIFYCNTPLPSPIADYDESEKDSDAGTDTDDTDDSDKFVLTEKMSEYLEYIKNFFENYTSYVLLYINENKLYFSYNLCEFYLEVKDDETIVYKRAYNTSGDYEYRNSFDNNSKDFLINQLCNAINSLEFLNYYFVKSNNGSNDDNDISEEA